MTTERDLLDAIHARLAAQAGVMAQRHVLAEHPRSHPAYGGSIADAVSIDTWASGGFALTGYEVKISRSDWLREVRDPEKSHPWRSVCTWWWLVTVPGVVRGDLLPGWGLLEQRGAYLHAVTPAPRNESPLQLGRAPLAGLLRSTAQTAARRSLLCTERMLLDRALADLPDLDC